MIPVFIKVHSVEHNTVYRINRNSINYYRADRSLDSKTPYTFIRLHGDSYVKVSESVGDLDRLLEVVGEE